MTTKQIPALPPLDEAPADDDRFAIRDTSSGSDKSLRVDRLDDRVNERGFAQSVDSVSTLRTSTFPASLERLWLSGYYGVGTDGGRPLYRVGGGFGSADDDGENNFVDADGVLWRAPFIPAPELSMPERRITNNGLGGGALTPVTVKFESGEIVSFYRAGSTLHDIEEGAYPVIIRSLDNGITWSEPEQIVSETGYDLRNYGGGVAPNGDLILWYCRRSDSGTDEPAYIISGDKGQTWGAPQILSDLSSVPTIHSPHIVLDGTIIQPMLADTPDRAIWLAKSTDNGATWTTQEIVTESDAAAIYDAASINESFICKISESEAVLISRADGGESSGELAPFWTYTEDGGVTWSALDTLPVEVGSQPPSLYNDGKYIWYLWPNRQRLRNQLLESRFYEYTPVIRGASTAGSHTYSRQKGVYTINNGFVSAWVSVVVDSWDGTASGRLEVTLPLAVADEGALSDIAVGAGIRRVVVPLSASAQGVSISSFSGRSFVRLYELQDEDSSNISADDVTGAPVVEFQITYPISAVRGRRDLESCYYASILPVTEYQNPGNVRAPIPMHTAGVPLHNPGDSGYGNVVEIDSRPYLIYYKGSFDNNGCDLYMSMLPTSNHDV